MAKKRKTTEKQPKQDTKKRFQLRIETELSNKIDKAISDSEIPISRNTWIIESIVQRLKRDKRKKS